MPAFFETLDLIGAAPFAGLCAALAAAIGLADYATGPDASFAVFYLVPVVWIAARGTQLLAGAVSVVAAIAWVSADVIGRATPYTTVAVPLWNVVSRLLVFLLVVWLTTSLRRSVALERELSRIDSLSGVANRRAFYEAVEAELRRLRRSPAPITIAYLDLDDFKAINDRLGHAEGDAVIRMTAETLRTQARDTDVVARLGGDEFGLLLANTSGDVAHAVLERVHAELLAQARQRRWAVGFSIGVVNYRRAPHSVDEMLTRADEVMYAVKGGERNRVRCIEVD